MRKQRGITVVEVLMTGMVLLIVGAVALPQLTTMQRNTMLTKTALEMVRSSYNDAVRELMTFPTPEELADFVTTVDVGVSPDSSGITFQLETARFSVSTYTDYDCTIPTTTPYEQVLCVDDVKLVN